MKSIQLFVIGFLGIAGSIALAEQAATNPPPAAAPAPVVASPAVAKVNDRVIKRDELDAALKAITMQMSQQGQGIQPAQAAAFELDVLNELIGRELLVQESKKNTIPDLDAKVKAETERVAAQIGGEEQLKKALADAGITHDEYVARVRENIMVQDTLKTLVEKNATVTDADIQKFYTENKDKFQQPPTVRASHILILVPQQSTDTEKAAKKAAIEALLVRVKQNEDFAALAKQFSEDPGSKENGGDLGFFPQGRMVPEFDTVAFSLKSNEVSNVIGTQYGYHIIKVTGQQPAKLLTLDEVKDGITQGLKRRKSGEIVNSHVAELRKAAKVEVLLPAPPAAAPAAAPVTTAPAAAPAPAPAAPAAAPAAPPAAK